MYRAVVGCMVLWALTLGVSRAHAEPLPGTQPLTAEGDLASELVAGVDRFLLHEIDRAAEEREARWTKAFASAETAEAFVKERRAELAHILGVRDERLPFDAPELVATTEQSALVAKEDGFEVFAVRWPTVGFPGPRWAGEASLHGVGLLLVPTGEIRADVIAIPHCEHTPEQIAGLREGLPKEAQFARLLAENGSRVLVPMLVSRHMEKRNGRANLTNREYLYRSAFELGRHLIGYEVQQVLAAVDWFGREQKTDDPQVGVVGYGEGGRIALYAAALDERIDAAYVSGAFGSREKTWQEPIDRNVFGLLKNFGDAEVAAMIADRNLIIDDAQLETQTFPGEGGAPATLSSPEEVAAELERLVLLFKSQGLAAMQFLTWNTNTLNTNTRSSPRPEALNHLLKTSSRRQPTEGSQSNDAPRSPIDPAERQRRQVAEIDRHNQWLLEESPYVRAEFMEKLDTSSLDAYAKSVEPYRKMFREQIIGEFDHKLLPPNARTRKTWETEHWTGYEVVLDVFPIDEKGAKGPKDKETKPEPGSPPSTLNSQPNLIAYGVLLMPKGIKKGERRPVVVCQHGLEGRPTDTFLNNHRAYHDYAAKLAERGFITFAPQNLYLFQDRFRTLQRKANLVGCTLFSVIVPQHQQIVNWLQSLPQVDAERIGFYGLSYGGKSAMRIPALVTDYKLSICSADFNDWVWKNASTRAKYSYVWTGEYEIFEFDLGGTFNYSEMAALIAPRPFMVERGHFDGVAPDERVALEFAKVRNLYNARLGIGDRARIEWFAGPHTIHGQGTFEFLHEYLDWPMPGNEP